MENLNLPQYQFKIRPRGEGYEIYDSLRRRYVALTPEEWVRQHFVNFLVVERQFPASLMNNEVSLVQNGIRRRCDTLVFDHTGSPLLIVEYKAPQVAINQAVFDQIVRYNMVLHARYLIVSNGMNHFCCVIDYHSKSYRFLPSIPMYGEL